MHTFLIPKSLNIILYNQQAFLTHVKKTWIRIVKWCVQSWWDKENSSKFEDNRIFSTQLTTFEYSKNQISKVDFHWKK